MRASVPRLGRVAVVPLKTVAMNRIDAVAACCRSARSGMTSFSGAPSQPNEAWNPADSDGDLSTSLREASPAAHHCPGAPQARP